ncbi:MFS transporter [Ammoniphilus sp. YIM 78166]|uniref:MFS transporter n=1 Tax=Ammoniphilus sp. YIM 78166 TaxID=1644106 RepID=UPI00107053E9|nr:MFS transporter [Ammoniphilus sp. YIM 78166]
MAIYITILINTFLMITTSGIKPVVSLYAFTLGQSPAEISVIIASYALLPAFLALQIGRWADHYGTRPVVTVGNGMYIIALYVSALHPGFITFLFQQAMLGVAFTCIVLCLQKRMGNFGGNVDRNVANFTLFASVGTMIGPILSTYLYEHYGYFICSTVNMVFMCIALGSEFLIKNPDGETTTPRALELEQDLANRDSIWTLMKDRTLRNSILIGGLVLTNRELFSAYFPLLADNMGINPTMTGLILSFSGLTMLLIRFSQTRLVESFGRMKVLTWSLYISGIVYFLIPYSNWLLVLFVLVGILGGGLGLGQPLSIASVLEVSPPERRGEVLGVRLTVNRISQFSIPLVFGGIGGVLGVSFIFWVSGLVLMGFGYFTRAKPVIVSYDSSEKQIL